MAFADRALAALEATGAMKPREPALPDPSTYTPLMTKFLDVYNAFDKDKLAALLARPVDPGEPTELAGYKALHGTCTAFKLVKAPRSNALVFDMTCEHGPFELEINPAGDKLGGFTGRSPGVAPSTSARKLIADAISLHFDPTWNAATYKRVFPKQLIPEPLARSTAKNLQAQFGTCKAGKMTADGLGWSIDLACSKAPVVLFLHLDPHGDIDGIQFHPPAGAEPTRCPKR